MHRIASAALLSTTACLGGPSARATLPPAQPLVVQFAADTTRVELRSHQRVEQVFQGQALASGVRTTLTLTVSVTPSGDGAPVARFAIDSLTVAGAGGGEPAAPRSALGSVWHARLRDGRWDSLETAAGAVEAFPELAASLGHLLPAIPAGGARPGARWTDTTTSATRYGDVELAIETISEHAANDWATWAGGPALGIRTERRYTIAGAGRQSGQEISVAGSGAGWTQRYLDPSGRYLGGTGADSTDLEVRVASSDVVIPVRQRSVDTVETKR